MTLRHLIFSAMAFVGVAAADDLPPPIGPMFKWCTPPDVTVASPAPATSNSDSLARIPFSASLVPFSAAVLVSLTPENRPVVECLVDPGFETGFEASAVNAVAGMVFSAPLAVNTAGPGGRYLVRISTWFGVSRVEPPPILPILPACDDFTGGWWFWGKFPNAPKPSLRVAPVYPERALDEAMEGEVTVVLDIFSNGDAIPLCLTNIAPPGWFEGAALAAVSQWRFEKGMERGKYAVTVKFKMED